MDASVYNMSFDKEQLSILCASYDRSIDRLTTENAKLRELLTDMWNELDATTQYDAGGGRGILYEFADRMRELGVDE